MRPETISHVQKLLLLVLGVSIIGTLVTGAQIKTLTQAGYDTVVTKFSFRYEEGGYTTEGLLWKPRKMAEFPGPRTLLVASHGIQMYKEQLYLYAQHLAERGFIVVAFDLPGHHHTGGYCQAGLNAYKLVSAGITWVLAHESQFQVELNQTNVGCFGHSMGGTTSIYLAATDPRVDATVTIAAIGNLSNFESYSSSLWASLVVVENNPPGELIALQDRVTPITLVNGSTPQNWLIIHGTTDDVVPVQQARDLYGKATSEGDVKSKRELYLIEGGHHTIDISSLTINATLYWFEEHYLGQGRGLSPELVTGDPLANIAGMLDLTFGAMWGFLLTGCACIVPLTWFLLDYLGPRGHKGEKRKSLEKNGEDLHPHSFPISQNVIRRTGYLYIGFLGVTILSQLARPLVIENLYIRFALDVNLLALPLLGIAYYFLFYHEIRKTGGEKTQPQKWLKAGLLFGAFLASYAAWNYWISEGLVYVNYFPLRAPFLQVLLLMAILVAIIEIVFTLGFSRVLERAEKIPEKWRSATIFGARTLLVLPVLFIIAMCQGLAGSMLVLFLRWGFLVFVGIQVLSTVLYNLTKSVLPSILITSFLVSALLFELAPRFPW